jgi:hypothetical protein|eukprot:COSAG01_NODE_6589_length_3590_cov_4.182756_1_plen_107_part_00
MGANLLFLTAAAAAAATRGARGAWDPLGARLARDPSFGPREVAPQSYVRRAGRRRAQGGGGGAALDTGSTAPLRIHVDFRALDESTAVPYASCFRVGGWFRCAVLR